MTLGSVYQDILYLIRIFFKGRIQACLLYTSLRIPGNGPAMHRPDSLIPLPRNRRPALPVLYQTEPLHAVQAHISVSYTHLDVYKRQEHSLLFLHPCRKTALSYYN